MTHLINGIWVKGLGPIFNSENPATGESIWEGGEASIQQVNDAVYSARTSFESWSESPLPTRTAVLENFRTKLEQNKTSLANTISQETGKPLWEALTEVGAMIGKIQISITAFHERSGEHIQGDTDARSVLRHKPHGVVAVFGPYNFPGHLPNGHIVPALLAGNAVVFKPSELTPLTAQATLEMWCESGLPAGALNMVQGGRNTGAELAANANIDGIFFTGSPEVGKLLHRQFAGNPGKMLALEMGGNNPLLVFETQDLKAAAYHTIQSAYLSAGQRCTCARRLIVPNGKAGDAFIAELISMMKGIKIGSPDADPAPFMGPVISNAAAHKLLEVQNNFEQEGGKVLARMTRTDEGLPFLTPGLMDVSNIEDRPDAEAFGPFLQLIRVSDFNAAINIANDTAFGLSAGLLSDDAELFANFSRRIRAGIVNWNKPITGASSAAPFGGIGDSGNLRPSAYYAADYCAYPVAGMESDHLSMPESITPGISL